ncbi:MAG: ATP-dependent RecD-like DNA helicase [Candidatus Riflebacteria bacterium HGW-Riflebacteria-1]|nr:MAG: ATP-dependent RecD-like DNA helicase [Candidatus Riflebacteria bacterium HGW-Riflebacteria-1]
MENECITVTIDRITFCNEQSGYYVLKASSRKYPQGVTVVGNFGYIQPGEEVRVYGTWACHPNFGMQFQAMKFTLLKPATLKGIEKYLGSGLIKGIGPATARRLVETFGLDTLEIIEKEPEKLAECPGIGRSKADKISSGWFLQRSIQDIMIFLQGHGISPAYAIRIFKKYDREAVRKISENPYILAHEVSGMGFKKADAIAAEFGITGNDLRRLKAGLLYVLSNATNDGHLFLREEELVKASLEALGVGEPVDLEKAMAALVAEKKLIRREFRQQNLYYLPASYRAEDGSAALVKSLADNVRELAREKIIAALELALGTHGLKLSEIQQLAVENSLTRGFMIITGGPGTGKTTTLKAVVCAHKAMGRRVMLASPTGRAAKRLAEVSGFTAQTIHRLLEFSPQEKGFKRNQNQPLDCDTLVVDEASMIDMQLFYSLLQAVPKHASLILVGDADQLPSVGAGLVLNELIKSDKVPVVRLNAIFRQAETSSIIRNAHLINHGQMPELTVPDGQHQSDCYYVAADEPDKLIGLLKNVVQKSLPGRFGYDPVNDIQVLTPMNKGKLGTANLNAVLQEALNPPSPEKNELEHLNRVFRVGDKVIQLRNNYDLDVFNGDIGLITEIQSEDQEALIDFPQGPVTFSTSDFLDLAHAYAVTVHKAQGSEYPAVVMLASTQHFMMLQRNLLYTGLTRARKTMVFIGTRKAIAMAVKNNRQKMRNTILAVLLQNMSE